MLHNKHGFTLVELAFGMALLAIVIAVLMPMYERSKEEQRKTACQDNLKKCITAAMMYWNDWDATLPSSAIASPNPDSAAVAKFLTAKGDTYPPIRSTVKVTWAQILSDYFTDPNRVFCPSDAPQTRVSYWWKYASDYAWRNHNVKKEGDYYSPADQVLLYEHAGWHSGDAAGLKNGIMINAAYMDGHVVTVTIRNGPTTYPAASDERTGASATRNGEPMFYNYNFNTTTYHPGVADYTNPTIYGDKF